LSDIARRLGMNEVALQHIQSWRKIARTINWDELRRLPQGVSTWPDWTLGADILEGLGMWDEALEWDEEALHVIGFHSLASVRREILRLMRTGRHEVC
jgi:hypothetical protein